MRKSYFGRLKGIAFISIICILLLLPVGSLAKETLVIYSYGGRWDEACRKATAEVIEKKYNCDVQLVPGEGPPNIAKLVAGKGGADLIYLENIVVDQGIGSGVLDTFTEKEVPNLKSLYGKAREFGNYGAGMMFGRVGIGYNYEKVKNVNSWNDLWDPKYKGHIGIYDLTGSTGIGLFLMANRLAGGSENDLTPGFNKLKELIPSLINVVSSNRQVEQLFTQADCWLAPWWDGRIAELASRNFPIKFLSPKEGTLGSCTYIQLVKGSKNRDLALAYINQSLDPITQANFASLTFYGPSNRETKLASDIGSLVTYGKQQVEDMQFVKSEYITNVRKNWTERFNKEIRK